MNDSMELLKILWIIKFFIFTLILIFIWSKVVVISRKIKTVTTLIENCEKIESENNEVESVDNKKG